jgi:hypothetical protein
MDIAAIASPRSSFYAIAHIIPLLLMLSNPTSTRSAAHAPRHELVRVKRKLRIPTPEVKASSSPLRLDCGAAAIDENRFWLEVTANIDGLAATTVGDAVARIAERIQRMRHIDPSIEGWSNRIDSSRAAVFLTYRCGAYSAGGRLLLLVHAPGDHWRVTDRVELPAGETASVVAHRGKQYILQSSTIMPRVDVATLMLVRAMGSSWWRLYIGKNLIGLKTRISKRAVVATWTEQSEWFDTPHDAPQLSFEATLRLTDTLLPVLLRSTTPWFQGLEDYCDERRRDPTVPCSGRIRVARVLGKVAEVLVSGAGSCSPGADDCPADSEVVVELVRHDWRFQTRRLFVGAHPMASARATAR